MHIPRNNSFFFIELIYLLIPISLVFSIAISDLFLIIIVIFFLVYSIKNKIFFYYKNKLFLFFILFCIYLILVSLIKNKEIPISVLFFFRFGLFVLATWFLLDNNKNLIKLILVSIFITCTIVSADALFQFLYGTNLLGYKYDISAQPRLSSFFNDELILGSYLSRLSPLVFLQLGIFFNQKKEKNFFIITFFIIFLFFYTCVIFATGERMAFIYYLLSIILFTILLNSKKISLMIICIFIISYFLISSNSQSRLVSATTIQFEQSFTTSENGKLKLKDFNKIPIGHIHHWKSTILMAKENIFFGVGPRMFREECKNPKYKVPNGCASHPHSIYFQLLGETGIFGFFSVLFFFLFIVKNLIINLKKNNDFSLNNKSMIICFSAFCLFLHFFPVLPNGNFFNNWINIITFLPMGIFLHSNYIKQNND